MRFRLFRRRDVEKEIVDLLRDHYIASGAQIAKALNINSGRLYVTLYKLERSGKITGCFVNGPYPRRYMYRVTER